MNGRVGHVRSMRGHACDLFYAVLRERYFRSQGHPWMVNEVLRNDVGHYVPVGDLSVIDGRDPDVESISG